MKNKALLAALLAISTLILSGCLTLDIISTTTTTASTSTSTTTTLAPAEDENILTQANAASCDEEKLAVTSGGREYVVVNRILADGASQTLTYEDDGDFEVSEQAQSPAAGPASFPSIFIGNNNGHATTDSNLPILYPDTLRIRSTWTWSSANAPTADFVAQYELWFVADPAVGDIAAPDKTLSIRLTFPGAHSPSGSHIGIVALEGKTWNVWKDGSNISYVAHETSTSVDFDLKAFIGDAIFRGAIANSDNLHDIFAGFKIWSNGAGLASSGFSVVVQ